MSRDPEQMGHLVNPIFNVSYDAAISAIREAHQNIVTIAHLAIHQLNCHEESWGAEAKRLRVDLGSFDEESIIGKTHERFVEVVNMAATMERFLDALSWFQTEPRYRGLSVGECHPTTSDDKSGNDLVLVTEDGRIRVRCEVCDVVSQKAGQNGKEKKDLKNLGCESCVPTDEIDRFIVTSPEFAKALTAHTRKWKTKSYRYEDISANSSSGTHLLKLVGLTELVQ